MDLARADAMLFHEDCEPEVESPSHLEGSEDEDTQKELEEMLYSSVYHESSSIDLPPSVPDTCPILNLNVTHVNTDIPVTKLRTIEPLIYSPLQPPKPAYRSEFNNPSRTTASRYYDVNEDIRNSRPIFVAPADPGQRSNSKKVMKRKQSNAPSVLSSKLLARSSNEQSYLPKATPATVKEPEKEEDLNDNPPRSKTTPPQKNLKDGNLLQVLTEQRASDSAEANDEQSLATPVQSLKSVSSENKQIKRTPDTSLRQNEEISSKISEDAQLEKLPQSTPRVLKKSKLQSFEAKVSKVLSSMLDEESRSSLEENQVASLSSAQELNDSGWSVGMSWADMSSKYSFGVDSIEEESVSSLQLHDSSFTADSRTNTPDGQTQLIDNNDDKNEDDESVEPSRYELQLKSHTKANNEAHANPCDTDSESEVGSVVEVAPPVKPAPVLVDISDGEYVPSNEICSSIKNSPSSSDDVTILASNKQEHSSEVVEHTIESSSDDDIVVLNVIDTSKTISRSPQKGFKRQSDSQIDCNSPSDHIIPPKRSSHHQDTPLPGTSKPLKMDKFEKWLHNPIKASKYLGHEKYLAKMSDNPSLWQLCRADVCKMSSQSPRGPKCVNCNEFGHKTHKCRLPRKIISCYMCGQPGHSETQCKEKMCLRCGTKNFIFTDRCRNCANNSTFCKICNARTHVWKTCPDLWRRYHLTTSIGNLTQPTGGDIRPRSEHWCSNCAGRGHLSHECSSPHWKCESISPFIRSYANVSAQENHFEGPQTLALMLTDDVASALDTQQGKEILKYLSAEYNVDIYASFDITFKKLIMKGATLAVEEVRSRVVNWTSLKEQLSRNATPPSEVPSKIASEAPTKNASETCTKSPGEASTKNASKVSTRIPNVASTKNVIEVSSLKNASLPPDTPSKILISPGETPPNQNVEVQAENGALCNIVNPSAPSTSQVEKVKDTTTKQNISKGASPIGGAGFENQMVDKEFGFLLCNAWRLPSSLPKNYILLQKVLEGEMKFIDCPVYCNQTLRQVYQRYLESSGDKSKSKKRNYSRILSIILLGKCGFSDGPVHVAALRKLLKRLKERKGHISELRKEVEKHFNPIFCGLERTDFKLLVDLFYSDETLVKKYDRINDDSECESDSSHQIELKDKDIKTSGSEENKYSAIDKPEIKLTPSKKTPKNHTKISGKLTAVVKKYKHIMPFVLQNLSSRFIFNNDFKSLETMYSSLCKTRAVHINSKMIGDIKRIVVKLCKTYHIKLPQKLPKWPRLPPKSSNS